MDIIIYLIQNGADPFHKDNYNNSPFLLAIYEGHIQLVELLYNTNKIDINECNNNETSPLSLATQ